MLRGVVYRNGTRLREPQAHYAKFLERSNPWALHGISERLLEAADRGMWEHPEPETLDALQKAYLETEGDLEDGR